MNKSGKLQCMCKASKEKGIVDKYCWTPKACVKANESGCESIKSALEEKKKSNGDDKDAKEETKEEPKEEKKSKKNKKGKKDGPENEEMDRRRRHKLHFISFLF